MQNDAINSEPAATLSVQAGDVTQTNEAANPCNTRRPSHLQVDRLETPIGTALLVTDEAGVLRALDFIDYGARMQRLLQVHYGSMPLANGTAPSALKQQLQRYFAGELQVLQSVAWATGGTEFQRSVWQALTRIPAGQTRSYGELAQSLTKPSASRAVGWANGCNPIAIVVPCHRVIGANGKLTGYAGGLHRKQWLLRHEGAQVVADINPDLFTN